MTSDDDDDRDTERTYALKLYGFPEGLITVLAQAGQRHANDIDGLLDYFPSDGKDAAEGILRAELRAARDALVRIARFVSGDYTGP